MSTDTNPIGDVLRDIVNGITGMLFKNNRELLTVLRQPTPQKISKSVTADASGNIPLTDIYMCPNSHEAWVNRITISSPTGPPKTPITAGEVICTGSLGELVFFAPIAGTVAPLIITEGRISAAHLNNGERLQIQADALPANTSLRFDLQVILVTGISVDTPKEKEVKLSNIDIVN